MKPSTCTGVRIHHINRNYSNYLYFYWIATFLWCSKDNHTLRIHAHNTRQTRFWCAIIIFAPHSQSTYYDGGLTIFGCIILDPNWKIVSCVRICMKFINVWIYLYKCGFDFILNEYLPPIKLQRRKSDSNFGFYKKKSAADTPLRSAPLRSTPFHSCSVVWSAGRYALRHCKFSHFIKQNSQKNCNLK